MSFSVTILGSSGAVPAYGRYPSAQLINLHNEYLLVDCGEGAQMQLARFDLPLMRINHIFISHLHGDHYLGLPGLLFTMHLHHRENDLHIYSPKGLDDILTTQLYHSRSVPCFRIVLHTLNTHTSELILEHPHFTVHSFPLYHKLPCCGFIFREKPKPRRIDPEKIPPGLPPSRLVALKNGEDIYDDAGNLLYKNEDYTLPPRPSHSYAYCSDTAYDEHLIQHIQGTDVIYHEATFISADEAKARETLHSTAAEAATIAKMAGTKKLLLGHFSARYRDLDVLLEEARALFPESELAIEGKTFYIHQI
ncbi:MAG: ribonuclease Z [Cyclobacteriaceae bacterium]|nr:ribonuclease Z [Cyclobacteriaceae bacterium]MDW8331753.1 ribonuclease Z [Cyclobacteriaceae bacterium]